MKLWMGAPANGHPIRVMALRSAYMTLELMTSFLKGLCCFASESMMYKHPRHVGEKGGVRDF